MIEEESGNSDGNDGLESRGGCMFCTGVAVISIYLKVSFSDFEVFFGGDVIEAVAATAQELAGVTVAAWGEKTW